MQGDQIPAGPASDTRLSELTKAPDGTLRHVQEPVQLPQHGTATLAARDWAGINAGDVGARLAVVAVQLCAKGHLQGPGEVLCHDGALQRLPAALAHFEALGLLRRDAHHLLCRLVEGSDPGIVRGVRKAAAQIEAWGSLTRAIAGSAEAAAVHTAVARHGLAVLQLLASAVDEGLRLASLLHLHEGKPADYAEKFRLVADLLACLTKSSEVHMLGV
mmetsp:Transcript_54319/g.122163  ORF Transcript_54319/g.122163 Transcript_54319/m.122163 type:complete len:217 (+) Transcript_54319:64-714(+)